MPSLSSRRRCVQSEVEHGRSSDVADTSLFRSGIQSYNRCGRVAHLLFGGRFQQTIAENVLPAASDLFLFLSTDTDISSVTSSVDSSNMQSLYCTQRLRPRSRRIPIQSEDAATLSLLYWPLTVLPPAVTQLTFALHSQFNSPFTAGTLPPTLCKLSFLNETTYDQQFLRDVLPSSLTYLFFASSARYRQDFPIGSLPSSLTILSLKCLGFDQRFVSRVLPAALKELILGDGYNQPVLLGVLPASLTKLQFGSAFNQRTHDGVLPSSLTHLHLGFRFQQQILAGTLPQSLTYLTFGADYNQPLAVGALPSALCVLELGKHYDQSIAKHVLPQSLLHIKCSHATKKRISTLLPLAIVKCHSERVV